MRFKPSITRILAVIVLGGLITGCYMPVRFDAEIEITRGGYYSLIYDGYLASIPLYQKIKSGKLSIKEREDRIKQMESDITRDSAVSEYLYHRDGIFKIHWEKKGDLLRSKMVSFLRRNQRLLSLKYIGKTGQVIIEGASIAENKADALVKLGLNSEGQLRIITDAFVVSHNATTVKQGSRGKVMYIWKIKNLYAPMPRLVIALK